jgi:hypothetical protein
MIMDNKELIDDNRIAIVSGLFSETVNELLSRNLKALQDAEGEIEVRKNRNLKDADEINRLKAKLSEQVDPIEVLKWYGFSQVEAETVLEQFKKERE